MIQATQAPVLAPTPLGGDPAAVYRALRQQSGILRDQQRNLQAERVNVQARYDELSASNPGRQGIERRLQSIDARAADLDQQIATSDQAVARAAGVPGATTPPLQSSRPDPDMVAGLSFVVVLVFAIPMSIAYARRIWRRSARAEVVLPPQVAQQLDDLGRGMEAIALEVERIGEGQRFVTQVLAERASLTAGSAGAAEPIPVHPSERVAQRR